MRVLIIDDEPIARRKIRDHLARHADMIVAGECGDLDEARGAIADLEPELIFLDIRLPGGDGLSFLRALGPRAPICILVTATAERALDAYELEAVDYLLKPFDDARFSRSLERARVMAKGRSETTRRPEREGVRLMVPDKDGMRLVRAHQIDWVEAEGNYAALHIGPKRHLVRSTIEKMAATLPAENFARVSRSAIVNLDAVARLEPWMGRRDYVLVMESGARVRLSRSCRQALEQRIGRFS
jgi:two-component system LytT family response regulator